MKKLLVINASGRVTRSITRKLTGQFAEIWQRTNPGGQVVQRDVGLVPPSTVNEAWIAAAFSEPAARTAAMLAALSESEILISELDTADAVVLGTPMYNFGMPAQLKAYFDQVVRVGRTFAFDPNAAEPYQPLLADKPLAIITSVGDGALLRGGAMEHLNFLEPHLETVFQFIGLTDPQHIRVGYEEFQDSRHANALEHAEAQVQQVARCFTERAAA